MSAPRRPRRAISGILLLDKPNGWSSSAATLQVRHWYRADKAGHTGSLDPMATGLLPICLGQAMSMGAVLLAAGTPGKRYSIPNSRIMIHQPSGGFQGTAADIEIHAKEILRLRALLNRMLAGWTGQTVERVASDADRDFVLNAEEAVEYGLIDKVIERRPNT